MLMTSSHIAFNILLDLIDEQSYFCFGYYQSNTFQLTKIFELLKLSLEN